MNDEIFDKLLSTFSKEELAGMYTVISKREVEHLKEIKILRLSLQSHGQIVDMNYDLREQLKELKQSKGSCFHCEEVALTNVKLKEENARLREALESILELNILGNDNQGKMAFVARKALERSEG